MIDIIVASITPTVQLHAVGLDIFSVSLIQAPDDGELQSPYGKTFTNTTVTAVDQPEPVNTFSYDHEAETVSIKPSITLTEGPARLRLRFRGNIHHEPYGLYRRCPTSIVDGVSHGDGQNNQSSTLSTHFEPRGARMVFPCFDEPQLKATFDIEIEVPHGLTVLGNTPVRSIHAIERSGQRRNIVALQRSPVTSTNVRCSIRRHQPRQVILIPRSYLAGLYVRRTTSLCPIHGVGTKLGSCAEGSATITTSTNRSRVFHATRWVE